MQNSKHLPRNISCQRGGNPVILIATEIILVHLKLGSDGSGGGHRLAFQATGDTGKIPHAFCEGALISACAAYSGGIGDHMEEIYQKLAALAQRHGARRLVLFGSRARGDHKERSDIDLAVYGMPQEARAEFRLDAEELPTLLKFDIVHITPGMNPKFLENIEKDGVILYASEN